METLKYVSRRFSYEGMGVRWRVRRGRGGLAVSNTSANTSMGCTSGPYDYLLLRLWRHIFTPSYVWRDTFTVVHRLISVISWIYVFFLPAADPVSTSGLDLVARFLCSVPAVSLRAPPLVCGWLKGLRVMELQLM